MVTMKDKQLNIRTSDDDIKLISSLRNKMPNKSDSEIIRTALKMLAIEMGAV